MPNPQAVLVTGSGGRVGQAVCRALIERGHKVRGFDIRPTPGVEDSLTGDLSDFQALQRATRGIEAVCHLAAVPDEDDFLSKLLPNNIVGLYHVLEACRLNGVKRFIFASTGQTVSGHAGPWPVTPEMPPTPRNWYASGKLLGEAAAQTYAHQYKMKNVSLRLGWCPRTSEHISQIKKWDFGQDIYLSPGDAGRLFACTVETTVPFDHVVCFGTSKPLHHTRFCIASAKQYLGYEPQDAWPTGHDS